MEKKNEKIDLSIVVPVYNVERYLLKCIDSILEQICDYSVEILLVDDGSTDSSGTLCNMYANQYPNFIKVYHKENGGLSDARNYGLLKAKGRFISFLDSDDYYLPSTIEQFYQTYSNDIDLIIGSSLVFFDGKEECFEHEKKISWDMNKKYNGIDALNTILEQCPTYGWYAWKYFIKRELLIKNNHFFRKGILFEDVDWTPYLFTYAKNVKYMPSPFYCYRLNRVGSIMNVASEKDTLKKFNCQLDILKKHVINIDKGIFPTVLKEKLYKNLSGVYTSILYGQMFSDKREQHKEVRELQFFIQYIIRQNDMNVKKIYNKLGYNGVYVFFLLKFEKSKIKRILKSILNFR